MQAVPSQQSALVAQLPDIEQQRPPAQALPSQQSDAAVHVADGSAQHAPSRQSSPRPQAVPPQQRWLASPQRPGVGSASGAGLSKSDVSTYLMSSIEDASPLLSLDVAHEAVHAIIAARQSRRRRGCRMGMP